MHRAQPSGNVSDRFPSPYFEDAEYRSDMQYTRPAYEQPTQYTYSRSGRYRPYHISPLYGKLVSNS